MRLNRMRSCRERRLVFESLESRWMLSASIGSADQVVTPNLDIVSLATSTTPSGLTPAQVKAAYGFSNVSFGSVAGNGAGETIAIVDAYNDPNIKSDLAKFDATFGLAAPSGFKVVNQSGGTTLPQNDTGWAGEIALDVEWAHAIAPAANILLVEASSATMSALDAAPRLRPKRYGRSRCFQQLGWQRIQHREIARRPLHDAGRTRRRNIHRGGWRRRCWSRISLFVARCAERRRVHIAAFFNRCLFERKRLVRRRRGHESLRRRPQLSNVARRLDARGQMFPTMPIPRQASPSTTRTALAAGPNMAAPAPERPVGRANCHRRPRPRPVRQELALQRRMRSTACPDPTSTISHQEATAIARPPATTSPRASVRRSPIS